MDGEGLTLGQGPDAVQVGRLLGRGGWGAVYEAVRCRDGLAVAVKILGAAADGLTLDDESLRRFADERSAAVRVRHPSLVATLGTGSDPRFGPYTVCELLPGETLRDVLARGPLPLAEVLAVARALLPALDALHRSSIVHRDVKPDNLLRGEDGSWKLGDFGLALFEGRAARTKTGVVVGTPGYLAPEAFGAVRSMAGPQVDLYGAGVLLVECLTGRLPFRGTGPAQILQAQMAGAPTLANLVALGVPESLAAVLVLCLDAAPERRPRSAADLLVRVEEAADLVPSHWRSVGAAAGSGRITVRAGGRGEPLIRRISTGMRRLLERRRRLALGVTFVLAVLLAAALLRPPDEGDGRRETAASLRPILAGLVEAGAERPWSVAGVAAVTTWLDAHPMVTEEVSLREVRGALPSQGSVVVLLESVGRPSDGGGDAAGLARALTAAGRELAEAGSSSTARHLTFPLWLCRKLAAELEQHPAERSLEGAVLGASDSLEEGLASVAAPALASPASRELVVAVELLRARVGSWRPWGDETLAGPSLRRLARSFASDEPWLAGCAEALPVRAELGPRSVPALLSGGVLGAALAPPPDEPSLSEAVRGVELAVSELRKLADALTNEFVVGKAELVETRRRSAVGYSRFAQAWWWRLWSQARFVDDAGERGRLVRLTLDLIAHLEARATLTDRSEEAWPASSLGTGRLLGRTRLMLAELAEGGHQLRGGSAALRRFTAARETVHWLDEAVRVGLVKEPFLIPPGLDRSRDPVVVGCLALWRLLRRGAPPEEVLEAYGEVVGQVLPEATTASVMESGGARIEAQMAAWVGWSLGLMVQERCGSAAEAIQRRMEDSLARLLERPLVPAACEFYVHGWDRLMGQAIQRAVAVKDRERLTALRRSIDAVGRAQPDPRFRERGSILVGRIDRYAEAP